MSEGLKAIIGDLPRFELRPAPGKASADMSKGFFLSDDWRCGKCGNVNWAHRPNCNFCNNPRFNMDEERTKLGGNFDECEVKEKD